MKITSILPSGIKTTRSKKIDKYIEVVGSGNPRLNSMALDSQLSIAATLRRHYTEVGMTLVNNIEDLKALVAKKPDLVVLGVKLVLLDPTKSYEDSPKVWLAAYLEEHGIAYTGSASAAMKLEFGKPEAKRKAIDAGLRSPAFSISTIAEPTFKHDLQFPLFIKPSNQGDSRGIDEQSVVYSDVELKAKILSIHNDLGSDALIEEYLPGREFSVAVIKQSHSDDLLAMPIEISAPADKRGLRFLSETVKEADIEKVLAVDDAELKNSLNALAIGVFKALGSRDYGRIDMRLDSQGRPSFIEANLMPGLSDHGYLARCFYLNERIPYANMILSIVELGFMRSRALPQTTLLEDSPELLNIELASTLPLA